MQNGLKIGNFDLQCLAAYYVEDVLAFRCTFKPAIFRAFKVNQETVKGFHRNRHHNGKLETNIYTRIFLGGRQSKLKNKGDS